MDSSKRFKINSPKVIHENFDDETVIVNLDTGNYYSFDKTAAIIWGLIESGVSMAEIIQFIGERYRGELAETNKLLHAFIAELHKEQLIIPLDSHLVPIEKSFNSQSRAEPNADKPFFQAPIMQKFTDMQDLLLLDPIHEVNEKGWPFTGK